MVAKLGQYLSQRISWKGKYEPFKCQNYKLQNRLRVWPGREAKKESSNANAPAKRKYPQVKIVGLQQFNLNFPAFALSKGTLRVAKTASQKGYRPSLISPLHPTIPHSTNAFPRNWCCCENIYIFGLGELNYTWYMWKECAGIIGTKEKSYQYSARMTSSSAWLSMTPSLAWCLLMC